MCCADFVSKNEVALFFTVKLVSAIAREVIAKFSLRKPKVFVSQILRHCLTKGGCIRKLFYCLIRTKEPCVKKFEGLIRLKILGILQTEFYAILPILFVLLQSEVD